VDNLESIDDALLGTRAGDRFGPLLSDAVAAGGGAIVAVGLFLVSIDLYADGENRWPGVVLFTALLAAGIVGTIVLPAAARPGCVAAMAISVPVAFGFLFFPDTQSFGDLRPFFLLTIAGWAVLWIAPRVRGRPLFVGLALALFWLWMLGEAGGLDAYSAAPVPSPPYMTIADFESTSTRPAQVDLDDLDPSDELYPLAQDCAAGDDFACDQLAVAAPFGSDLEEFGQTCGGRRPPPDDFGASCALSGDFDDNFDDDFGGFEEDPLEPPIFGESSGGDDDKTLEVGLVSLLIAGVYLLGMTLLDRSRYRGLATAFVVPAIAALITGVAALGDWSGESWAGGLLAFAAGLLLGLLGQSQRRRFTTWVGGLLATIGVFVVALDVASIDESGTFEEPDFDFIGPGLLVMLFGAALVAIAWVIAWYPRRNPPSADDETAEPPAEPEPVDLEPA
jgi:hypothetical protein